MPPIVPVTAVIKFTFVPIISIGGWNVRLETIGLAAVVLTCLIVAALIARRTPVDLWLPADDRRAEDDEPNHLRADDLLYIAVGSLPGAVVGGRLGYALLHLDYYGANPSALLDVGQGSLQLSLAIVGGTVTAALLAGLAGAPVGRWMHALILPLLLAIAGGKAVLVLGGDGQGMPFDGSWATAYLGAGPWGSLAPEVPSHPAQVYEALAATAVVLVMMTLLAAGAFPRRGGGAFLAGIALWADARAVVATTWRDPLVAGPLRMDQVISIAIGLGALLLLGAMALKGSGRRGHEVPGGPGVAPEGPVVEWPDPEKRPRL